MKASRSLQWLVLAAAGFGPAAAEAQGRATVEIVQGPPGLTATRALGISDAGHLVGYLQDANGVQGWLRGANGALTLLSLPNGSVATAVNVHGEVAGHMLNFGLPRAARWSAATGWQALDGDLATGINASGQIIGESVTGGWRWSPAGGHEQLPGPVGFGVPRGLNDAGWVVGDVATQVPGAGAAALWRPGQAVQLLPGLGNVLYTNFSASAVNASGLVVGGAAFDGTSHVVLWDTTANTARDLGTLAGGPTNASAISAAGQVVGWGDVGNGQSAPFLWREGVGMTNLASLAGPDFAIGTAHGINQYAQIVVNGAGTATQGSLRGAVLTLHPDWQGGNGRWDDGQHWNWAGTGVAASVVGAMHDVRIAPAGSVVVSGAAEGIARTLVVGGTAGRAAVFDLAGGRTTLVGTDPNQTVAILGGGVLRGHGQLDAAGGVFIENGGRIEVAAGQRLGIASDGLSINRGVVRVQGVGAEFSFAGGFNNNGAGRIDVTQGSVFFNKPTTNDGQINLQDALLDVSGAGSGAWLDNRASGRLAVSFGRSTVAGLVVNQGLVVVSNGAQASFLDALVNNGELRVSTGGAANFFGLVSGGGSITGNGAARFEGGLSVGASPGLVTVNPDAAFGAGSTVLMELGGTVPGFGNGHHDKIVFNGAVTLEGGTLDVTWWDGFSGAAGDSFDLFDWNGTLSGRFGQIRLPGLADGLVWQTGDLYAGGSLSIAAVPEPSAAMLMLAGLATLGSLARRRRV